MTNVVVLTRNYVYWGERPLHSALRLIVKGKVEVVAADESREIRAGISRDGAVFKMPAPLVIRLLDFVGIHYKREEIGFSKEAVFERDNNFCQYYHTDEMGNRFKHKCSDEERTIDHVIPRVKGGPNTFLNCVTCCRTHNERVKRGRSLKECGLQLLRQPFEPKRRRGDMVVLSFRFNQESAAHKAYRAIVGG